MKKTLLFLVLTVAVAATATAQMVGSTNRRNSQGVQTTGNSQLGIHIGYAPQTYIGTTTSTVLGSTITTTDTMDMTGFFVGIDYNINLSGDLNVNVGVQGRYNTKNSESTLPGATTKDAYTQMLVDIPILFNYGFKLSNDVKLSVFAGPTIIYALSGRTKSTITLAGLSTTSETNWYGDNSNIKQLDVAGTAGVALTFNNIRFFGGYNMGLLNTDKADGYTRKGNNIFVGLGLKF